MTHAARLTSRSFRNSTKAVLAAALVLTFFGAAAAQALVCPTQNPNGSIQCSGGTSWCGETCQTEPSCGAPKTLLNCATCACVCPADKPYDCVATNGQCQAANASCAGFFRTEVCDSAPGSTVRACGACLSGYTDCAGTCKPTSNPSCPPPSVYDPCTQVCVEPFVRLNPAAPQNATIKLTGDSQLLNGDVYLSSGKSIRVDSAGASTLGLGNWGGGTFTEMLYGQLGIGGGTPGYPIDVQNATASGTAIMRLANNNATRLWTGLRLDRIGPTEKWFIGMEATDDNLYIRSGGTTNIVSFTSAGNVGIGTSTPGYKLDVNGTINVTGFRMPTSPGVGKVLTSDAVGAGTWQTPAGLAGSGAAGQAAFWTGASTLGGDNGFFWDNTNKRLGIGLTTPQHKLDISGTSLRLYAPAQNVRLVLQRAGTYYWTVGLDSTDTFNIKYDADGTIYQTMQLSNSMEGTALGFSALQNILPNAGSYRDTAVGYNAGKGVTGTAVQDITAIGYGALEKVAATGNGNTAVGSYALNNNTTGSDNVALGSRTGLTVTTGSRNTLVGSGADVATPGLWNSTAIGYNAVVSASNSLILGNAVNVGIGTSTPAYRLDVGGTANVTGFRMPTDAGAGKVLTSDAAGLASWQASSGIGGSGAAGQAAFWTGASTLGGDNGFYWDNTNKRLGIGTVTPFYEFELRGTARVIGQLIAQAESGSSPIDIRQGLPDKNVVKDAIRIFPSGPTGPPYSAPGIGSRITFYAPRSDADYANWPTAQITAIAINPSYYSWQSALAFNTETTERMRINYDGNVGIGTTTPGYPLDIRNAAATGTAELRLNNDNATKLWTGTALARQSAEKWFIGMDDTDDKLRIRYDGTTDNMVFDTYGRVGIGTESPGAKLNVAQVGTAGTKVGILNSLTAYSNGSSPQANYGIRSLVDGTSTWGGDDVIGIYSNMSATSNSAGRIRGAAIYHSGVWDGDSIGLIVSNGNSSTSSAALQHTGIQAQTSGNYVGGGNYGMWLRNWTTNSLNAASKYGMYVVSYGAFDGGAGTTNNYGVYIGDVSGADNNYSLYLTNDSAWKPTTTTWKTTSDARTKEDVTPFADGLNVIRRIDPVNYTYNGLGGTPKGERGIGVLAQDIAEVAPYTVSTYRGRLHDVPGQDNFGSTEPETDIYLFTTHALTFVTINAIKELDRRLDQAMSLDPEGGATLVGDLRAEANRWGSGTGWLACPEKGECSCPDGSYVTSVKDQGAWIKCHGL